MERNIPWDSPIKTHFRIPFYRESGVTLIQHLIEIRPDDSEKVEYYAVLYYHTGASPTFFARGEKKRPGHKVGLRCNLNSLVLRFPINPLCTYEEVLMDFDQKVDFYIARNYLEDRLNGICLEFNRENGCYASYNCYDDLYHGLLTIKRQGHMECRYHINGELHGPSFDWDQWRIKIY